MNLSLNDNLRILIIDDNQSIHDDFRKVLSGVREDKSSLKAAEAALFGGTDQAGPAGHAFTVDSSYQGQEGLERVREAVESGSPYALAFVDIRMPPGWDGIETIGRLWEVDPQLQVVICTAYSDYSWEDMLRHFGFTDRLLVLKKPFDSIEVRQIAHALVAKWNLNRRVQGNMDDLEAMVRERTREIEEQRASLEKALKRLQEAHAQLLQSDKMASIGQLAAGVAHEINNPIGFISSNLNSLTHYVKDLNRLVEAYDAMLESPVEAPAGVQVKFDTLRKLREELDIDYLMTDIADVVRESIEGTQRVRQIVADLRDFSHVDHPERTLENINQLLDKTVNVAWNELKYKAKVVREYGELTTIACYGGKLGQVFLNLLVNAAHAIEDQGTITVRTGQMPDYIWIEVQDSGCGISTENLNRIFEPFFTTKGIGHGTGMGLHLAYKIVEAHCGRITVDSIEGEGTTFRIELPLHIEQDAISL